MDEIMDTKVVQMKFDNSQFRAGVEDTIKQLAALDKSLQLQGASDGLDQVVKASKKTTESIEDMSDAVDEVQKHFSMLEVVGITVMMRLTNAVIDYSKKTVNRLWSSTIGQVISGGKLRSQNIENAKFQLAGLGVAWKDISEDINYGVKDTAYGLDEAARVASQLVASQVELGNEMKASLRAISGVAAMTNSQYGEIGHIFTTVASNGKLMTMQLRELSNRGLNASAQIARYFREVRGETEATEESINNMVSRGLIDFQTFASAMDWAFGEHAKEANKTFQGAMSNVRSALSRIGAKFADPVYDNLRKVFNGLIPVIDNINKAMDPVVQMFTLMVNAVGDLATGYLQIDDMSRGFMTIVIDIYSYLKPILEAFMDIFGKYIPLIDTGTRSFSDFVKQFALVGEKAEKARDIFKSLFSVLDLFVKVGISGFKILKTIVKGLLGIFQALTGSMEPPLDILYKINIVLEKLLDIAVNFVQAKLESSFEKLAAALKLVNWEKVLNWVTKISVALVVAWELLLKLVNLVIVGFTKLLPILQNVGTVLAGVISAGIYGIAVLGSLISNVFGRGRDLVSTIVVRAQGLGNVAQIQNADETIASTADSTEGLNEQLAETTESIDQVNDRLDITSKNVERLNRGIPETIDNLARLSKGGGEALSGSKIGSGNNSELVRRVREEYEEAQEAAVEAAEKVKHGVHLDSTAGFFETLASYFISDRFTAIHIVAKALDDFCETIYEYVRANVESLFYRFGDLANFIKEHAAQTVIAAVSIIHIAGMIAILKAVYGLIDFLPALGRAASKAATSLVLAQIASIFKSIALFMLSLTAIMAVMEVIVATGNVDKFEKLLDSIAKFILKITFWIGLFVSLISSLAAFTALMQWLSDVGRLAKGLELRTSSATKIVQLIKAFSLMLASIVASIVVMVYLFDNYNADDIKDAMGFIFNAAALVAIFAVVLQASGYALTQGTYTLSITAKGITKSAPVFRNSLMGVMIGMSLIMGTIMAFLAFILPYYEDKDKLIWAGNIWGMTMTGIVGFLAILVALCKWMEPKIGRTIPKIDTMKHMADAVANVAKVVMALGTSALMIAGALWIVSQIQIPEDGGVFKAFYIISGIVVGLAAIFPVLIAALGHWGAADVKKLALSMAVFALAMSAMMLSIAGMFKMLEDINTDGMPLKTIIALVSIVSALMVAISVLGKNTAIDSVWPTYLSMSAAFAAISAMFVSLGYMIELIGDSGVTEGQLKLVIGLISYIVTWASVVTLVIGALGAIPELNIGVIITLFALSSVFTMMGVVVAAAAGVIWAFGETVKKIVKAIDDFANIDWRMAKKAARDCSTFIMTINRAIAKVSLKTILGLGGFSLVCREIAKAIKELSGIDADSAIEAAKALGGFLSTIVDYKRDISKFVEVMESINAIIWLAVAASIGLSLASAFITAAVLLLVVPAAIMYAAGDAFEAGLIRLVDALVAWGNAFEDQGKLIKQFVFDLFTTSLVLLVSAAMLDIALGLLWYGAVFMDKVAQMMDKNFETFIDAIVNAGEVLTKNEGALDAAAAAFVKFGVAAIASGGLLALAAVVFGIAAAIIVVVAVAICWAIGLAMSFLEDASDDLVDIGENIDEFMQNIESAADRLFNIADSVNEASKLWSEGVNRFLHPIRNAETDDTENEMDSAAYDAVQGFATSVETYMSILCPGYGFANTFIDQVRGPNGLDEHSPSRVTYEIGKFAVEGFANGINDNKSLVQNSVMDLVNEVSNSLDTLATKASESGKKAMEGYAKGVETGRRTAATKTWDPAASTHEDSEAENREQGYRDQVAYNEGQAQGQNEAIQQTSTFETIVGGILGTSRLQEGKNTIGSFVSGLIGNMGVNVNNIKGNVKSLWERVAQWIGNALENGVASAIDQILRYIAKVRAMNQDNWNETQRQAQALASGNTSAYLATTAGIQHANEYDIYRELKSAIHLPTVEELLGSIDDLLYGLPSASVNTSGGDYTSDLASAISGSSGAGSGIDDRSKSSSIGGGVGNTITNSNNTYNFYQNNYSPEPLNRSAIYQQTRQQLNGFYTYVKEKNLSY